MTEDWTETLTDDQKCMMRVLSGLVTDVSELMGIMTRGMKDDLKTYVKLGYVQTLIKALELEEENDRN